MNRKKLIAVAALVVLALACSETVGGMMQDAGAMLADAGDAMQPDAGAQDTPATCDVVAGRAEFPISNPGETFVTVCYAAELTPNIDRDACVRSRAWWYEGTTDGFVFCQNNVTSITVHN